MNRSLALVTLVPAGEVTLTSTAPDPAGAVAVICESLTTVKFDAAADPNLTAVAPVKLVPVIVTLVPPAAGPDDGLIPVTAGGSSGGVGPGVVWR